MTTTVEGGLTTGSPITSQEHLTQLPPESVVRCSRGHRFTKSKAGEFVREDGEVFNVDWFAITGVNVVESIPGVEPGYDLSGEVSHVNGMTLARYQQRIRTVLTGQAMRRLEDRNAAVRVLNAANCPEFPISPGMVVAEYDRPLISQLPVGTVLVVGSPDRPATHCVFGIERSGQITQILGRGALRNRLYTVENIPGVDPAEWFTAAPSESEAEQIRTFQRAVWDAGWALKEARGWCSEYEQIMQAHAGLTATVAAGENATLDAAACRALPQGSIVRYSGPVGTVIMLRDDISRNPARTVRIGGSIDGAWASRGIEVLYRGSARTRRLNIFCDSHEEMNGMPEGTVISDGGRDYTRRGNGWVTSGYSHTYNSADFGISYMRYVRFPTPEHTPTTPSTPLAV